MSSVLTRPAKKIFLSCKIFLHRHQSLFRKKFLSNINFNIIKVYYILIIFVKHSSYWKTRATIWYWKTIYSPHSCRLIWRYKIYQMIEELPPKYWILGLELLCQSWGKKTSQKAVTLCWFEMHFSNKKKKIPMVQCLCLKD